MSSQKVFRDKFRINTEFNSPLRKVDRDITFGNIGVSPSHEQFEVSVLHTPTTAPFVEKAHPFEDDYVWKADYTFSKLVPACRAMPQASRRRVYINYSGYPCELADVNGLEDLFAPFEGLATGHEYHADIRDLNQAKVYASSGFSRLITETHDSYKSSLGFFQDYPIIPSGFIRPQSYFSCSSAFSSGVRELGGWYHLDTRYIYSSASYGSPLQVAIDEHTRGILSIGGTRWFSTIEFESDDEDIMVLKDIYYYADSVDYRNAKTLKVEQYYIYPVFYDYTGRGDTFLAYFTRHVREDGTVYYYREGLVPCQILVEMREVVYEKWTTYTDIATDMSVSPIWSRYRAALEASQLRFNISPLWYANIDYPIRKNYVPGSLDVNPYGSTLQLHDKLFNLSGDYVPPSTSKVSDVLDYLVDLDVFTWESLEEHFDACRNSAYARSSLTTFNGLVTAAGLKDTSKMLLNRLKQALNIIKIVIKGRIDLLPELFKPSRKQPSSMFLEWNFGWQQLYDDLVEIKRLFDSQPEWSKASNWSKGSHKTDFPFTDGSWSKGGDLLHLPEHVSSGTVSTLRLDFGVNYDRSTVELASGLATPFWALWDIIPLSWVIDLFMPIGTWIKAVEQASQVRPLSESFTYTVFRSRTETRLPDPLSISVYDAMHYGKWMEWGDPRHFSYGDIDRLIRPALDNFNVTLRLPVDERHNNLRDLSFNLPLPATPKSLWSAAALLSTVNNLVGRR